VHDVGGCKKKECCFPGMSSSESEKDDAIVHRETSAQFGGSAASQACLHPSPRRTILLQCPSLFTNSSNFSKQHTYFTRQRSAEVIEILYSKNKGVISDFGIPVFIDDTI
jgi:hypothetical protein